MSSQKTQLSIMRAVGFGSIAGLIPASALASSHAPQQVPNDRVVENTTTNDVGCSKETIIKTAKNDESKIGTFLYNRPAGLDIGLLSDAELQSCGLPPLRGIRKLPKTSSAYKSWLKFAHGLLGAKQLNPWDVAPLPPGYPPIPAPAGPSAPPEPNFNRHSLNEGASSVAPGGYGEGATANFASRTIFDTDFSNNGNAASPVAQGIWITPLVYTLPPATPAGDSIATQFADWIGYQDREDRGTGGTSLAQVGVLDNVYTASTGGAFFRTLEPFVEFYPDGPIPMPAMAIQPGDTVASQLSYAGSSTFSFTVMDSNASGTTSLSGFVNLYRTESSNACAGGTSGAGTPITICNNGDLVEWDVEDHGQYTSSNPIQANPATPVFGTIGLENALVTWGDSEVGEPNDNTCNDCPLNYHQADIYDTTSSGQTLSITPAMNLDVLDFPYSSAPYPGFNWPNY